MTHWSAGSGGSAGGLLERREAAKSGKPEERASGAGGRRRAVVLGAGLLGAVLLAIAIVSAVLANTNPQPLPFAQDWSNTGLITTNNNWDNVPGIVGYRGDDLTVVTGTDPQTVTADGASTPVNVLANQTNPNTQTAGGLAEFEQTQQTPPANTNPTVALQGSGTADAPHLVINLDTRDRSSIRVRYNLRDIDGSADNAVQQVALQYRVGNSGPYTNVPAGYVADATTGPSFATQVTPVDATLPQEADNQSQVQVRVITTNAPNNDEWVGVDDIDITGAVINDPPQNNLPGPQTVQEDTPLVFSGAGRISTSDPDAGNNPVQVTLSATNGTLTLGSTPAGVTVTGNGTATVVLTGPISEINTALDGLTFIPTENFDGEAQLTIATNDQGNTGDTGPQTDTDVVAITVNAVNDAPVAANDSYTTGEDEPLTVPAPGVLSNDTDVESSTLTAVLVDGTDNGTLTLNEDGSFTYAPENNFSGADTFTYQACEQVNPSVCSEPATATITVTPANDAPVAGDQAVTVDEDTSQTITLTATDADGDDLTFEITDQPDHGDLGSIGTVSCTGTAPDRTCSADVTYTSNSNYNGPDSFTYTVSDGQGGTDTATVSITVTPVNDDPVAVDDAAATDAGESVSINVLANDTDVDGDALSVHSFTQPSNGTVTREANNLRYSPNSGFDGTDTFTYTVSDGRGGTDTATVTVTVTPASSNAEPVAQDQAVTTREDTPKEITLTVTDADDDSLTFEITDQPDHGDLGSIGTVSCTGTSPRTCSAKVTYTPDDNYNGPDSFKFRANDGEDNSNEATVTITVTPGANKAPVANDDSYEKKGKTLKVGPPGVLGNDTDPDGDELRAELVSGPSKGKLTLNPDGSFTYSKKRGFKQTTFTYKACDASSCSESATVTIRKGGRSGR